MIIRKQFRRHSRKWNVKYYSYEGWYLFGIVPLYVRRITVYT